MEGENACQTSLLRDLLELTRRRGGSTKPRRSIELTAAAAAAAEDPQAPKQNDSKD
jgi:hypothetical protein